MPKGEASSPPTCKLCGVEHWSYQPHDLGKVIDVRARLIENQAIRVGKVAKPKPKQKPIILERVKKKKQTLLERKKEQGRKRALAKIQSSSSE